MTNFRFWIAVVLSGSLHAGALAVCLLDAWRAPDTPPELLQAYGDSDREGFNVEAVSLDPGTWRQGDQGTPGGDDAQQQVVSSLLEEQPQKAEPKLAEPSLLPLPTERSAAPTKAAPNADPVVTPRSQASAKKDGLPGAPGGADLPLGTPSRGGTVGKPTGLKLLRAGRKTYPAESARLGHEGIPLVWLRISEDGDVVEVKLHRSCGYPLLDGAALNYALTMKFRPAHRGDTAVESTAIQPVQYELP
jgi:TonB family protein